MKLDDVSNEWLANQLMAPQEVDTPILRARRMQAKAKRISRMKAPFRFRLAALIAGDNRKGTHYAV